MGAIYVRHKMRSISSPGLLDPLPAPNYVWEDITIDFIESLSPSNSCTVVIVLVDRLSKYVNFVPLKHPITVIQLVGAFFKQVGKLYGFPNSIASDSGGEMFSSEL